MSNQFLLMAATDTEPSSFTVFMVQAFPFITIGLIIYLLIFRPQQMQMKKQRDAIAAVKKGDEVVTGGGHIGKVTKVAEHEVEVEFASGHRHRVVKSMLSEVRSPGGAKPAND